MIFKQMPGLYIPFLILSIIATIIASQAMISGMFSIVYQGITTHILPMMKVDYTSRELPSQIYISAVNWVLLLSVLFIMFEFKESHRLAGAYGLAVTGTMTITAIMMVWIFYLKDNMLKAILSLLVTFVIITFLLSNMYKIPHGGYWSIILASIPFSLIIIYTTGLKKLHQALQHMDRDVFLEIYKKSYNNMTKINGTALFFTRNIQNFSPYIIHTMFKNDILYEDNIIVSIIRTNSPSGVYYSFTDNPAEGLRIFEIRYGYMEIIDVENILRESGIAEKTIFYGIEDIVTENISGRYFRP